MTSSRNMEKAAQRGEPSYVWRAGQERRLEMILDAAGSRVYGQAFINGCGVGMYLEHLGKNIDPIYGLDIEFDRLKQAKTRSDHLICGAGEELPLPSNTFDLILSHEVLEHVADDQKAVDEMIRVLRPGGRLVLFCPNRGYPFETHGVYWRGKYHFGNIPLVNYLPHRLRDDLAPHVRVYTRRDLKTLFEDHPVKFIQQRTIFGAYDNIISRWPPIGRTLRGFLQWLEKTPLQRLGLSHFWVVEKE